MTEESPSTKSEDGGTPLPESISVPQSVESRGQPGGPPGVVPILPVRSGIGFPGTITPLTIGRAESLRLIDDILPENNLIGIFAQRDPNVEKPGLQDLYPIGVIGKVAKLLRQDAQSAILLVETTDRIQIVNVTQSAPYIKAEVRVLKSTVPASGEDEPIWKAKLQNFRETAQELLASIPGIPPEAGLSLTAIEDPAMLTDFLASNLSLEPDERQALLEETDVAARIGKLQKIIAAQLEIAQLQKKLHQDVQSEFSESQKRAYLRQQIRSIQKELGEDDAGEEQLAELRQRIEAAGFPEKVMEHAMTELKRLEVIPPVSPEHSVLTSYLEMLVALPWNKLSEDNLDLDKAQEILDRDHFGLKKVKTRIIEYLAVRKLNPQGRGPILCFVGPPGVGKTSLGKSIAAALGREFSRISLGGIRDEAEIRGHRRTYIGAMPGRLIQELRRAGTRNPVIMLDEVDKIGTDFRGDPASALLEVLDPRQNNQFTDRYLDVPFDLSQVIFIATANTLDPIPRPLLDRMEVIEIAGYTAQEKLHIANDYLIPRQLEENGLESRHCQWVDDAVLRLIDDYTRESGVRNLERKIGGVIRNIAAQVARDPNFSAVVTAEKLETILGPPAFVRESKLLTSMPGVVTGLAYTSVGGEVLHIEAIRFPGKGGITLTGQLGDVMKESVKAALSLVKSRAQQLGIDPVDFERSDVHLHVPAGAVPKDGPSAGVAMFTSLASLFSQRPVNKDVAMTGEISLRGLVLPIGGLKEKTLAALNAGIKTVLIPSLNKKDIPDLPDEVREQLEIIPVGTVDEVLDFALKETPEAAVSAT